MSYKTTISVVLPAEYRKNLEQLARDLSNKQERSVSICELVRDALETTYGFGKQSTTTEKNNNTNGKKEN